MTAKKTSRAVLKTARINPDSGAANANAYRVIEELERDGWSFGQIVIDAVNRADGKTPEMFDSGALTASNVRQIFDEMLDKFMDELVDRIGRGQSVVPTDTEIESGNVTPFAAKLAKKMKERSQQLRGE